MRQVQDGEAQRLVQPVGPQWEEIRHRHRRQHQRAGCEGVEKSPGTRYRFSQATKAFEKQEFRITEL